MAISFVGSYVGTHAATSAQSVAFSLLRNEADATPTLVEGDIVLVAVENASTVNRTQAQLTPSGYTPAHTDRYENDSNDSNFLVSYKVMGATPDTTVSIPASNATTAGVAYAIYVFRGVNTATPLDVEAVPTGAINTGVANAGAITPTTPGAWIVVFGGAAVAAGAVFTNPAGMSTTTNHFRSATITTTTNDANIGGAIYTGWTSDPYDPAAFGGSTTTNTGSWSAVTIALRPYFEPATGTLDATENGTDAAAFSGTVADPEVTGTLAAAETGGDTASFTGSVAAGSITGTLAATEAGIDSATIAGSVVVSGSLAATSTGTDTAAASGSVAVSGLLAAQDSGSDTAAGLGNVAVSGAMAAIENGADTAALAGLVVGVITGSLAANDNGTDGFAGSGEVVPLPIGALAAKEGARDAALINGRIMVLSPPVGRFVASMGGRRRVASFRRR